LFLERGQALFRFGVIATRSEQPKQRAQTNLDHTILRQAAFFSLTGQENTSFCVLSQG